MTDLTHSPYHDEEKCPDIIPCEWQTHSAEIRQPHIYVEKRNLDCQLENDSLPLRPCTRHNFPYFSPSAESLTNCRAAEERLLGSPSYMGGMVQPGQPGGPLCTGTLKKGAWDVGTSQGRVMHVGPASSSVYQHMATLPRHDSLHLTLHSSVPVSQVGFHRKCLG